MNTSQRNIFDLSARPRKVKAPLLAAMPADLEQALDDFFHKFLSPQRTSTLIPSDKIPAPIVTGRFAEDVNGPCTRESLTRIRLIVREVRTIFRREYKKTQAEMNSLMTENICDMWSWRMRGKSRKAVLSAKLIEFKNTEPLFDKITTDITRLAKTVKIPAGFVDLPEHLQNDLRVLYSNLKDDPWKCLTHDEMDRLRDYSLGTYLVPLDDVKNMVQKVHARRERAIEHSYAEARRVIGDLDDPVMDIASSCMKDHIDTRTTRETLDKVEALISLQPKARVRPHPATPPAP